MRVYVYVGFLHYDPENMLAKASRPRLVQCIHGI